MTLQTRREMLARTVAAAGSLALGERAAKAAEVAPAMAIAKWTGAANPSSDDIRVIAARLAQAALEGVGGLTRFVTRGSIVWVKPNIGWDRTPEQAANTNPEVVATIVKACFNAGAKAVKVGDNTVNLAPKCYAASGIEAAAKAAGAEVLLLDRSRAKEKEIGGEKVKTIPMFPEILECDVVINCPVVKHHRLSTATLCMKNYMGVIENRKVFHQDIPACLVDITRFMKPRITLLDATRILVDHGPSGGDLKDVRTLLAVAAGTDIVALDAWGADVMGRKPGEIPSIAAAEKAGLGRSDYRALAPKEIAIA